jgi:hypothetical protein
MSWWKQYPRRGSRLPRPCGATDRPDPRLVPGTFVRLKGKPDRRRRVLGSEWHWSWYEFVYFVETSARAPFRPYWFARQLEIVEEVSRN